MHEDNRQIEEEILGKPEDKNDSIQLPSRYEQYCNAKRHLRGTPRPEVFPIVGNGGENLRELTSNASQEKRVYDQSGISPALDTMAGGNKQPKIVSSHPRYGYGKREVGYSESDISPTIRSTMHKRGDNDPLIIQKSQDYRKDGTLRMFSGFSPTIRADMGDNHPMLSKTVRSGGRKSPHGSKQNWDSYEVEGRIRRLTPVECERLQGFPDNWTRFGMRELGTQPDNVGGRSFTPVLTSDSQRYKMCGNAVTVNVIQAVMERILA